ncbi:MAG: AAA family ATPase [Mycobacterium sp.]|nr:AAA family ATPase [Mycobacterium sp.]
MLVGRRVVTIPPGHFSVRVHGARGTELTVKALDSESARELKKGKGKLEMTDFESFAAQLGVRVKPKPAPPAVEPEVTTAPHSNAVRPGNVATMIGNDDLRLDLVAHVKGSQALGEPIGHVLLTGPSGLGKTSMARLIADMTGGKLIAVEADSLESPKHLFEAMAELVDGDAFLIDETHGLTKRVMRTLLTIMEDGTISVATGSGAKAEVQRRKLPRFTLVCATTDPGELSEPFRNRFPFRGTLEYYEPEELAEIVIEAGKNNRDHTGKPDPIKIDEDAAADLGRRSRGTPRLAVELLHASRRMAAARGFTKDTPILPDVVDWALERKGIDKRGLNKDDRAVLRAICRTHKGGPVGLEHLAATLGIANRTLDKVIEPYLVRTKLLIREPSGRRATDEGYRAIEMEVPVTAPLAAELD